jgi:hypothetical protein
MASNHAALMVEDPPETSLHGVAHLVLKQEWPIALCGFNVSTLLGTKAPAMDRCSACLKIAAQRKLGRPGWHE